MFNFRLRQAGHRLDRSYPVAVAVRFRQGGPNSLSARLRDEGFKVLLGL